MKKIVIIVLILGLVITGAIEVLGQPAKHDFMKSELNKIENYLIHRDSLNKEVSKVAVAWHLDHSLKVINRISDTLRVSEPEKYKRKFSVARTFSFTFGYIPRGRATSPPVVRPPDTIKTADIVLQLVEARENIIGMDSMDENAYFRHPVFGKLNKKQAKRFLEIHTKHHLKIVRDILKE